MPEEHAKVKLRQLTPYPPEELIKSDDGIYVWEQTTGILRQANVSQLPFGSGGGGTPQPLLGSPFKVRLSDSEQVQVIEDPDLPGVFNTIITDERLVDKDDYPVSTTQLNNACFRDSDIVYDAVNGKVTLKNFSLIGTEIVILYPDGVAGSSGSGGNFAQLREEVDFIKVILGPFYPTLTGANGGRVIWNRPIAEIPVGWIPDADFDGMVAVGQKDGHPDFATMSGIAGSDSYTLIAQNLPDFSYESRGFELKEVVWRGGGTPSPNNGTGDEIARTLNYVGGKQAFKIIQRSRIVKYIKFVGI